MPVQRCPRCGTARRGDLQVCVRCESPFDAPDVETSLPRPAAPATSQSHGTVIGLLLVGFVVLGVLLYFSVRNIGPFRAQVLSTQVAGSNAVVTVEVRNEGDRAGHGKCAIARKDSGTGDLREPFQFLSERVPAHSAIRQTVQVPVEQNVVVTTEIRC